VAADDYLTNKESNCYCSDAVYLLPWVQGSLVPRPFPPPVFDHLQYGNTEEEGLGDMVTCGYVR